MYLYKVFFKDGSKATIRANSPKQADEIARLIGEVANVRFIR
jgi:hypothetical protein